MQDVNVSDIEAVELIESMEAQTPPLSVSSADDSNASSINARPSSSGYKRSRQKALLVLYFVKDRIAMPRLKK